MNNVIYQVLILFFVPNIDLFSHKRVNIEHLFLISGNKFVTYATQRRNCGKGCAPEWLFAYEIDKSSWEKPQVDIPRIRKSHVANRDNI
jgi:hypothetical protein